MGGGAGWGAVAQIGSDIAGSALGAVFAQAQAKKAFKRSVKAYRHRYQWQMEDMRKAGLNPILAYKQGAGSAPGAQMAQAPATRGGNIGQNIREDLMFNQNLRNMQATAAETHQRRRTGRMQELLLQHQKWSAFANSQMDQMELKAYQDDDKLKDAAMKRRALGDAAGGLFGTVPYAYDKLKEFLPSPSWWDRKK